MEIAPYLGIGDILICNSYYFDALNTNTIKHTKTIEDFSNELSKII